MPKLAERERNKFMATASVKDSLIAQIDRLPFDLQLLLHDYNQPLATVFGLLSGMASCLISRMAMQSQLHAAAFFSHTVRTLRGGLLMLP